jgi:phage shock protein C
VEPPSLKMLYAYIVKVNVNFGAIYAVMFRVGAFCEVVNVSGGTFRTHLRRRTCTARNAASPLTIRMRSALTVGRPPAQRPAAAWSSIPLPRLTLSLYDRKIAGVCGGLARSLGVDPTFVRFIWLVGMICFPPLLLGYFAAWILVPREPPPYAYPFEPGTEWPGQHDPVTG